MGVSGDTLSPDLSAAIEGGESFSVRLGAIQQAKKDYDESLAALNLGRSAVAAYDDAKTKQEQATQALADAQLAGKQIIAAAEAKASEIITGAVQEREDALAKARDADQQAKLAIAAAHKQSTITLGAANETHARAQAEFDRASKIKEEQEALHAEATKAKLEAEEATGKANSILAKLKAVLSEMG